MKDQPTFENRLRARNLKATTTRLAVLSALANSTQAMPHSALQNAMPGVDRVTLYRTIQALTETGIIHKAMVEEGETYYALCSTKCTPEQHQHKHIHFKCTQCQNVTCVQANQAIHLSIPGHQIHDFDITASGICQACSAGAVQP